MLPVKVLRESIGAALAADVNFLADDPAPKVKLAINDFVEDDAAVVGDLTEATFTGYAALLPTAGAQLTGIDPLTGEQLVTLVEPAGGWRFKATNATGLPMTVYGYYLVDNAGTALLALKRFDEPITLTGANQEINLGTISFRMVNPPAE